VIVISGGGSSWRPRSIKDCTARERRRVEFVYFRFNFKPPEKYLLHKILDIFQRTAA
jgi:hypothetical protein